MKNGNGNTLIWAMEQKEMEIFEGKPKTERKNESLEQKKEFCFENRHKKEGKKQIARTLSSLLRTVFFANFLCIERKKERQESLEERVDHKNQ